MGGSGRLTAGAAFELVVALRGDQHGAHPRPTTSSCRPFPRSSTASSPDDRPSSRLQPPATPRRVAVAPPASPWVGRHRGASNSKPTRRVVILSRTLYRTGADAQAASHTPGLPPASPLRCPLFAVRLTDRQRIHRSPWLGWPLGARRWRLSRRDGPISSPARSPYGRPARTMACSAAKMPSWARSACARALSPSR